MVELTIPPVRFRQSKIDECMFYRVGNIYILYTGYSILVGPGEEELRRILAGTNVAGLDTTEAGEIKDLLGVNIYKVDSEIYHMS